VAALRAEIGETVLWEQLARRAGTQAVAHAGSRRFRGVVIPSYPEFLVLHDGDGTEHLIRYGPATTIALPAETATLQPTPAAAATCCRSPSASSHAAASRSGSSWSTAAGSTAPSKPSAATTWRSPNTTPARHAADAR